MAPSKREARHPLREVNVARSVDDADDNLPFAAVAADWIVIPRLSRVPSSPSWRQRRLCLAPRESHDLVCVEKNTFGQRGLARVDVGADTNISDLV